jgi:thiol:disulfide interchange protein
LATFLGTACTAPFLSAAIGTASKYSAVQGAAIFMAVGVGMMFPFLILSAKPGWLKFVPKPGPWMGTFEAAMGFLLLGTVVWLINPLGGQIGAWGMLLALMFLVGVAVAVWVRGKAQNSRVAGRKFVLNATSLGLLALAWLFPFQWMSTVSALEKEDAQREHFLKTGIITEIKKNAEGGELIWPPPFVSSHEIFWVPYDEELVRQFVEGGYTVFVDFTADWCASCKTNLKTSIDVDSTIEAVARLNVVTFEADYTRKDASMKRILERFDRAGVPMYLVYSPNNPDNPRVLPEFLTPQIVLDALEAAGPSAVLPGP